MVGKESLKQVFKGTHTAEVFEQIKEQLGDDAVILGVEHLPGGGVQVSAQPGVADQQMEVEANDHVVADEEFREFVYHPTEDPTLVKAKRANSTAEEDTLQFQLSLGVDRQFASKFISTCARLGDMPISEKVEACLRNMISVTESVTFKDRFVCVLGSAGSGKTSAVFKLALKLTLDCGISAGVLHLDSSQIPEIKQSSRITVVSMPLLELSPVSLGRVLAEFADCQVVFVDLPNCQTLALEEQRSQLIKLYGLLGKVESVFLIDASAQRNYVWNSFQRVRDFGISKIVISKVEQGTLLGPGLSVVKNIGAPIAFLSNGPRIPEDVEPASYSRIAWIFSKQLLEAGCDLHKFLKQQKVA